MFLIPSGCYRLPISVRRRMAARSVVRFSPHISHISRSAGSFPWGGISFVRFMHFAFGISDFDEKRYLITMLLGKGVMVAMMALFGQSLVSSTTFLVDYTYSSFCH